MPGAIYNNKGATDKSSVSGFTLIELLLVIAIIGILSGIVLSSLNSARLKAKDAKVMAMMNDVRNQVEILSMSAKYGGRYSPLVSPENDRYSRLDPEGNVEVGLYNPDASPRLPGICRDGSVISILRQINKISKNYLWCAIGPDSRSWVIITRLPSYPFGGPLPPSSLKINYCVDSSGFSGKVTMAEPAYHRQKYPLYGCTGIKEIAEPDPE